MDIGQMYGGDKKFSAKGIQIAYKHFRNLGYDNNNIIIVMKYLVVDLYQGLHQPHHPQLN